MSNGYIVGSIIVWKYEQNLHKTSNFKGRSLDARTNRRGASASSPSFGTAGKDLVSDIGHIATTRLLLQTLPGNSKKQQKKFINTGGKTPTILV